MQCTTETPTLLLSAGKTDDIIRSRELNKMRPGTCKPRILDQIKEEREMREDSKILALVMVWIAFSLVLWILSIHENRFGYFHVE